MRQHREEFEALGLRIAIVTFEADSMARAYRAQSGLSWPLLVDERRELYRAYGMLKASFLDVWGPRTWLAYARGLLRGVRPGKPGGDVYQRGGDVLIDPEGVVRLHHVGRDPADRPAVETLLETVRRAPGG